MDFMYLGIAALMGVATYGLLKLCEWLSHDTYGEQS
jgi:hypothetical protein